MSPVGVCVFTPLAGLMLAPASSNANTGGVEAEVGMRAKGYLVALLGTLMVGSWGCATDAGREVAAPGVGTLRAPQGGVFEASAWTVDTRARCQALEPLILSEAARVGQDPALVMGMAWVESRFRADAVSSAGAIGLLQVMPMNGEGLGCGPLEEPEANLACGLEVLRRFLRHYDEDIILALSAYNAGYRMPNRARSGGTLPANMRYVEKVLAARSHYLREGCSR